MSRQLRELEVLEVLIAQGAVIPCKRCRVAFTMEDVKQRNIENEHLHEKALGGPDEPGNRAFSHKAKPCHGLVTHGNGATFAGSSRHKIAKTRPERADKFEVRKPDLVPAADKTALTQEWARCRGCGEYVADCICPKREKRPAFQRAR